MDIKQNILQDVDTIISSRVNKYDGKTAIEKYFLYREKLNTFEYQLKKMISPFFSCELNGLREKSLSQILLLLQKKGERMELVTLLKKNIKNRNEIAQHFCVDKTVSRSLGLSLKCIDEKYLSVIIYELEILILFCEWSFLIRSDSYIQ